MNDDALHPAAHPQADELTAYMLGELALSEAEALEAHLRACVACRATLAHLDAAYVAAVERQPAETPPSGAWSRIRARVDLEPSNPPPASVPPPAAGRAGAWRAGMAASLALAVVLGAWGAWQRDQAIRARAELGALEARVAVLEAASGTVQARADGLASDQGRLSRWLARGDVTMTRLPAGDDGVAPGAVLFLPDGRALVVMRDLPSEARAFQVWGVRDGTYEALARTEAHTVEVQAGPYARLAVSLEPEGGSDAPTELLGEVPAS